MEHSSWIVDWKYLQLQGATTAPNGWDWADHEGYFLLALAGCATGFVLSLSRIAMSTKARKATGADFAEFGVLVLMLLLFVTGRYWIECIVTLIIGCLAFSRRYIVKTRDENVQVLTIQIVVYGLLFLWSLWHFIGAILESYSVHHHLMKHVDQHVREKVRKTLL